MRANSGYIGAFADGELIGIIGYFRQQGEKLRHKATLFSMDVKRTHRGSGAARGLLQTVLGHLRGLGNVQQVQLAVVASNRAALRLDEKSGLQSYGHEKRCMEGKGPLPG